MKILITGGASGIGKEISACLARNITATVIITYCGSEVQARELEAAHANIRAVKCDFRKALELEALYEVMENEQIDVLVNNAWTGIRKEYFHKTAPEHFMAGFMGNIMPAIGITQRAIGIFRKKKFGKIITLLSSAMVNKPPIGWSGYVAEKSYLMSMAKSWATENARFNITSNMVSPSFVETAFNSDMDERVMENMKNDLPLKKFLTGQEVAEAVYFLVNCSQQINGHTIIINQGIDLL
jgi:NAD(P)-dependent dehydrogenase (short-subunit alcohol dehydrogenase family)